MKTFQHYIVIGFAGLVSATLWSNSAAAQTTVLVHVEGVGSFPTQTDAQTWAGTIGQKRRLEGFQIIRNPLVAVNDIEARAKLGRFGFTPWTGNGQFVGTQGQKRPIEGFAIRLTGPTAQLFTVKYRGHFSKSGDTGWYQDGALCAPARGTHQLEALWIVIEPRQVVLPR